MGELTLRFKLSSGKPVLIQAEFKDDSPVPWKAKYNWTKGPQALAIFFVRARAWKRAGGDTSRQAFQIEGVGPAKSLWEELKKNKHDVEWPQGFLGGTSSLPRLKNVIGVHCRVTPTAELISTSLLSPDTIHVFCEGEEISDCRESLEWLATELNSFYFSGNYRPEPKKRWVCFREELTQRRLVEENGTLVGNGGSKAGGFASPISPDHYDNLPNNLPHPDEVFIGRERELDQISKWLNERRHRAIALTGIGGTGKSSLALAAAYRNMKWFKGVIYSTAKNLVGPRPLTLDDVFRDVDAVLKLGGSLSRPSSREERRQLAAELLNRQPYLLILDNLEVLTPEQTGELADFLQLLKPGCGTMAILTLRPEYFPPLVDQVRHDLYILRVESLELSDAIALLGEKVQPSVDTSATPDEQAVWAKIPCCEVQPRDKNRFEVIAKQSNVPAEKVGPLADLADAAHRNPLLLRFAAADLKDPACIWVDVLRRLQELRGKDLQDRVEDMIGKMCDDLARRNPGALTLTQSLLVFSSGAAPEALRAVWCVRDVNDEDEGQMFEETCRAARRSTLLDFKGSRYDLHPLVRQYLERRRPPGTDLRGGWSKAHASYFLNHSRQHQKIFAVLDQERLNLLAAMEWAACHGVDQMTVEFARHLFHFILACGFWTEGRERLTRAIAGAKRLSDQRSEAYLLHELGVLCRNQGDHREAEECNRASLSRVAELDEKPLKVRILCELGILCRHRGEFGQAKGHYEESLRLAHEVGDPAVKGWTPHELGVLLSFKDEDDRALDCLNESMEIAAILDDLTLKANSLLHLSVLFMKKSDYAKATFYGEAGLAVAKRIGDTPVQGRILNQLGELLGRQRDVEGARLLFKQSIEIKEQIGDRTGQVVTYCRMAELEFKLGNMDAAENLHRRSLECRRDYVNPYWRAQNHYGLAVCAEKQSRVMEARQLASEALKDAEPLGIPSLTRKIEELLARLQ